MNFNVRKVLQQLRFYQRCAKKYDLEEHLLLFLERASTFQNILYILNASNKTWINENDIVVELPFLDMTSRGNQYKLDSEL